MTTLNPLLGPDGKPFLQNGSPVVVQPGNAKPNDCLCCGCFKCYSVEACSDGTSGVVQLPCAVDAQAVFDNECAKVTGEVACPGGETSLTAGYGSCVECACENGLPDAVLVEVTPGANCTDCREPNTEVGQITWTGHAGGGSWVAERDGSVDGNPRYRSTHSRAGEDGEQWSAGAGQDCDGTPLSEIELDEVRVTATIDCDTNQIIFAGATLLGTQTPGGGFSTLFTQSSVDSDFGEFMPASGGDCEDHRALPYAQDGAGLTVTPIDGGI